MGGLKVRPSWCSGPPPHHYDTTTTHQTSPWSARSPGGTRWGTVRPQWQFSVNTGRPVALMRSAHSWRSFWSPQLSWGRDVHVQSAQWWGAADSAAAAAASFCGGGGGGGGGVVGGRWEWAKGQEERGPATRTPNPAPSPMAHQLDAVETKSEELGHVALVARRPGPVVLAVLLPRPAVVPADAVVPVPARREAQLVRV